MQNAISGHKGNLGGTVANDDNRYGTAAKHSRRRLYGHCRYQ